MEKKPELTPLTLGPYEPNTPVGKRHLMCVCECVHSFYTFIQSNLFKYHIIWKTTLSIAAMLIMATIAALEFCIVKNVKCTVNKCIFTYFFMIKQLKHV